MVCDRKVMLLAPELFREWERGSKRSLFSGSRLTQLHKIKYGGKTDLLIEKESSLILAG